MTLKTYGVSLCLEDVKKLRENDPDFVLSVFLREAIKKEVEERKL